MIFLDTNILIYSVSSLPEERGKRDVAAAIIDGSSCVLSVQVLQEFYHQVTRPTRPTRLLPEIAAELVEVWMRFRIQENTVEVLLSALDIVRTHKLSIWDALIVAAAQKAGCETLMTEDLSHGQKFGNLRVENPFLQSSPAS